MLKKMKRDRMLQMFFRSTKIICFFLFLLIQPVYADSASDELNRLLSQLRTMRADFTQTVIGQSAKSSLQSQGRMLLVRPGKFRWQVFQPNKQLIITNNNKLWIYDEDLEQVTIRLLAQEAGEAPAFLLSNTNQTFTKSFNVSHAQKGASLQWFSLIPKSKNNLFAAIYLGFSGNQIQQMQLQDHLGHTTLIRFSHIETNIALSPSFFVFRAPANVDVIDETRD